jgi:quercetin dioxygenase-like cupin family protein
MARPGHFFDRSKMTGSGEAGGQGGLIDSSPIDAIASVTEEENMKTSRIPTALLGTFIVALLGLPFFTSPGSAQTPTHVMEGLAAAKWGPAPPMLPPGAQIAVLAGDPTKPGRYAVRLKFPANYDIPAHSHPEDENVVVASGELFIQMGTKLDRKTGMALAVGGYALMPAHQNHFAYTKGETTIVLYGQGPVDFKYVNPNDDPRTKTSTSKR